MTLIARAALSVLLLLGVYVLAVGVVGLTGFVLYQAVSHGLGGFALGKALILAAFLLLGLGRAFWAVTRLPDGEPSGLVVSAQDQPELWSEVHEIAEAVGTRAPDEIRLVAEVNASVWEQSRFLGLIGGRRVMTVGAPLVLGLTRRQLRAVLAHEMGHFSHRHTALAPIAYRGQVTLGHIVDELGPTSWTGKVFDAYGRLYLRLTHSVTRRQELEADRWSSRVAGRDPSAGALRELPALDSIWDYFLKRYAFPVEGVRPDAFFIGFAELLASPQRQRALRRLRHDLPEEEQSPYDTHPTLRGRVEFFEALPADGVTDDGTSAVDLLVGPEAVLHELESELFADSPMDVRPWEWIAETAGAEQARAHASLLARATREAGGRAPSLQDAISALGRGDGRSLVASVVPDDADSEQITAAARDLVSHAVSAALIDHCDARFTIDWDRTGALVGEDGHEVDVAALVAEAVDRESAELLIRALEDEGVPTSVSFDATGRTVTDADEVEPEVLSVAACVHWRRTRVLVVSDCGLIIKRLGLVEGVRAAFRHRSADGYRTATLHVASLPIDRLLDDRRATLFAWDQIDSAALSGSRLRLTIDGRNRRFRVVRYAVSGDLMSSLELFLGHGSLLPA
ncbi:M48 family metallopeptidase [Nocardioides sp.]|uniref:M48 family metallopeptidase n=1 Tax=Nocardioides sp. TaxID=35761 RepID=UPI002ED12403